MSRGLTSGQIIAVTAENVRRVFALSMEFDGGTSRIVTAPHDIVIDGDTFTGGLLAEISGVEESAELSASTLTGVLSGIPTDAITIALSEPYQGRRATLWLVPMDDDWQPIDPIVVFQGRMDQMEIELGDTARVTLTMSNRLVDWERARVLRYSHEEQLQRHPGDVGLQYAAAMETKEVTWPNRIRLQAEANR